MSIDLDLSSLFGLRNCAWRIATRVPRSLVRIAAFKRFMDLIARYGGIMRLGGQTQEFRSSVVRTLVKSKR